MRRASLIVAMGGYNTTAEILACGKPAVLVPRATPRAEQRMRATILAQLGLVWMVEPEDDIASRLAELVPLALTATQPRRMRSVDLGGVDCVGDNIVELVEAAAPEVEAALR